MADSARRHLLAWLRERGGSVESSEVVAMIEAAGYRRQVGYQVLSAAVKAGDVVRNGDSRPYTYSLADHNTNTVDDRPSSVSGSGSLVPSIGLVCATPPLSDSASEATPSGSVPDMNTELVAGVFDADIGMTLKDVVKALEGKLSHTQVAEAMNELIHASRMQARFDLEEGASIFWIVEPNAEPDSVVAPSIDPADEKELGQDCADHASTVVYAPKPGPTGSAAPRPHSFTDRIHAIASQLEDAIGDACDARLPHELIKPLVVASGAAHRAARALQR